MQVPATAIILAGGRGSRLNAEARGLPKCLTPILRKPVLQYLLEWCARWQVAHVRLYVAQMAEQVIRFVEQAAPQLGLQYSFFEEPFPAGTAGGLALDPQRPKEDFLFLYGDVLVNVFLPAFYQYHRDKGAQATLAVHPNDHPWDSDLLEIDNQGRITAVFPKPHNSTTEPRRNLVNAALYILSPSVYPWLPSQLPADFARDVLPALIPKIKVYGFNTSEYIKDMGTPERLAQVEEDVRSGIFQKACAQHPRPAVFLDRDGTLNPEKGFITRWQDYELMPGVGEAIRKLNAQRIPVVVVTNQSGVARNLMSENDLRLVHNRMEQMLAESGAWVDDVLYCPHHPDKGYPEENPHLKVACNCRKPAPGMLLEAAQRHHLHLPTSFMIGDARRDVEAGRAAGCTTIGLRTGVGCRDTLWPPDIFCNDLSEAVTLITSKKFWEAVESLSQSLTRAPGVLITGFPSSGKSTLAGALHHTMKKLGRATYRLHLDFWIQPFHERSPTLSKRLGLPFLCEHLEALLSGESVSLQPYLSASRTRAQENLTLLWPKNSFFIAEGVAGALPEVIRLFRSRNFPIVFCHVSDNILRQRVRTFYAWKGLADSELEYILSHRLPEELNSLRHGAAKADFLWSHTY
ncbi:MAG: HAD-IIIA family hydrolase [Flavobacteriales bacterium]|nr:HAD-IIIA family hydrolase [Flavobacteriales bacterium]MDW8410330.1 HAD-IIIA family hydrolase [Flavobacteriales bacterium]